ncbi:unnamed protein product [Cylindrotheca closterium]|uniref:Uncharacterized protein n=1 Tax=Cylindrotheca closterium TaxID=2856 RepID=A0AAD2FKR0_9STRA|nr:unnamed protein product [Cylindrotheca closterium]
MTIQTADITINVVHHIETLVHDQQTSIGWIRPLLSGPNGGIWRKQAAQQSMAMSNKAFVGDEVNEWFEHKREQHEAAECIYQALMAWHKFSPDKQPPSVLLRAII